MGYLFFIGGFLVEIKFIVMVVYWWVGTVYTDRRMGGRRVEVVVGFWYFR